MIHAAELTAFDAAAILIVLAACLAYLNQRVLRLPPSIALTVMGAVASLIVVAIDRLLPEVASRGKWCDSLPASISTRR